MKIVVVRIKLIVFSILIFYGCATKSSGKKSTQGFVREALPARGGKELFESIKTIRDSLKLDTLENGYDSLEIRIWMILAHKQMTIVIKNDRGNWSADFISFEPIYNSQYDSVLGFTKSTIRKSPRENWNEVLNKLLSYNVMTLPDQGNLPHYDHPFDGLNLAFEISTKQLYRLYSYHEPHVNMQIPEAKDVVNILQLIKDEFNEKLLDKC